MLKLKRKIDLYSVLLVLIVLVLSVVTTVFNGAPAGLFLGILAGSLVMEKDIRGLEKENMSLVTNLVVNLTIYAVALVVAFQFFGTVTFFYTAIGLIGYRNVLLLKLK